MLSHFITVFINRWLWIQFTSVLLTLFAFVFLRAMTGYVFFLVLSLSAFSVSITWPQVSLFSFVEKFEMDWYSFLFQGLVEFTSKAILSWTLVFVFSEDFDYWFILLTSNWFVQTFFPPWFSFIGCILLGICPFLYLSKILAYNCS